MKLERHLFVSDFQIPDHNKGALKALLKFIADFKPDSLHIVGDFLNFTKASDYEVVGDVCPTMGEEIKIGRAVLYDLVTVTRKYNKKAKIYWFEGNHCYRLQRFLAKAGNVLTGISDEYGEQLVSIEHIFDLKKHKIEWIPYYKSIRVGDIIIEHGHTVRSKAGYTAQAQLDRYGNSGVSGHTHRLSLVSRKYYDDEKWWMELGCLCNPEPSEHWAVKPDWQLGFGVGYLDPKTNSIFPVVVPIIKGRFQFNGKVYSS